MMILYMLTLRDVHSYIINLGFKTDSDALLIYPTVSPDSFLFTETVSVIETLMMEHLVNHCNHDHNT